MKRMVTGDDKWIKFDNVNDRRSRQPAKQLEWWQARTKGKEGFSVCLVGLKANNLRGKKYKLSLKPTRLNIITIFRKYNIIT